MYAIIESCGKQYKVAQGDVVFFEKLEAEEGKKVTFDNVILVSEEGKVQVGNPYVKGVKVEGKVISHGKAKKIIVFKMKPKKGYRRKYGHRQPYTKVEITNIQAGTTTATKTAKAVETAEKEKTAKATTTTSTKTTSTVEKKETTKKEEVKTATDKKETKK